MIYKIENITVKASFFKDAQKMIEKRIQPIVNQRANEGWRLHSFVPTESTKGINIVLVWEWEKK